MTTRFTRVLSVIVAVVVTGAYLLSLLALTYGACFMDSAGCEAGWTGRNIATAIYLVIIAAVVFITRWRLRRIERR